MTDTASLLCQTSSVEDTRRLGKQLGTFMKSLDGPLCVALIGDLGTGKTHFSQGIAIGFGINEEVTSPTFALMNTYETAGDNLYHFDLYRLDEEDELAPIGFDEFTDDTKSIVEWADKFPDAMPEETLWVTINRISDTERKFIFSSSYIPYNELVQIGGPYVFGN